MRRLKRGMAGLLVLLMLIQTTGCTTWKTVSLTVAAAEDPKKKVRVVLQEGGTITSDSVMARGDTVVTYQAADVGAIPLAKVKAFQVHRSNDGGTLLVLLGVLAALFAAYGSAVRAAD